MGKCIDIRREAPEQSSRDILTSILRVGAQKMLQQAIEEEINAYITSVNSSTGERTIVRNGYLPERMIQSGIGDVRVQQPRCRSETKDDSLPRFSSKILPPYLRRTKSLEEMIPWLYLKGVSSGDFQEALAALLGDGASGLSATTVTRLKGVWKGEYEEWERRSLKDRHYVYIWADGVYFNVRLGEDDRNCILVIMGATADGKKELLAVKEGYRESELAWAELLLDLRSRGLTKAPSLAIADGALGFWAALSKVYPTTKTQRCWVHKTANVLDKLPKSVQPRAKKMIHEIYNSPRKSEAERVFDLFIETFEAKHPKAVKCLVKDRESMLTFYDFPAEHWPHIRTTNPIESTFATVRLRTNKTKGCGSGPATLLMVFKLAQSAQKNWRRLRGYEKLADVIDIRWKFVDGEKTKAEAA
jgi:putative transposase